MATTLRDLIGRRVRTLRMEHSLSQEELAARAGLHRNYVGSIERSERDISVEVAARLAGAFGLSLADFFSPFRAKRGR